MKRTANGLPILYQREGTIRCMDEFGDHAEYTMRFTVQLVWCEHRLRWGISTGDYTCWGKRLSECVIEALEVMATNNPKCYRMEEFLDRKYWQKKGERWRD